MFFYNNTDTTLIEVKLIPGDYTADELKDDSDPCPSDGWSWWNIYRNTTSKHANSLSLFQAIIPADTSCPSMIRMKLHLNTGVT